MKLFHDSRLTFRMLINYIFFITCFYIFFRHSDSKNAIKDERGISSTEDDMADVYPLQLRLSVQKETNSLGVRISRKVSLTLPVASF